MPKRIVERLIPKKRREFLYKYIASTGSASKEGHVWAVGMATAVQKIGGLKLDDREYYTNLTVEWAGKSRGEK